MPRFRFRSLEMPYTTYKLKNLASFFKGKGYSKNDLVSSGYPIILYGRMYTDYKLNIKNITDTFVKDDIESFKSKQGDVIIPASGETAKDISIASNIEAKGIIIGGDLNVIRPNRTMINSTYLALNLSNGKLKKELVKKAQGKSIVHIHNTDLMDLYISLPSLSEQKKIGDLFAKLDRLLDLQQQKLDQLELLKKNLLQKLFPKQGAKIPELRFKGFEEEWEKKKFLNCLTKIIDYRGRTPKKLGQKWSDDGKYRALSALNVKNGYIDKNNDAHFGDFNLYKKWMGKSELKKGDILFTTEAPMGNVAIINDDEKYILSQRTIAFRVDHNFFNNLFLSYILRTTTVNNKLKSLSTGGTAQGVSQKSLSYLVLAVTNNAYEQQKIGNLLAKVDRLIELENKKNNNLKLVKKSLLQNMFVE